jgi:uncharacterized protein (TIGR02453 family)
MTFIGFSKESVDFFNRLKENNNKEWFNKNKEIFETKVLDPAKAFVVALGEKLHTISTGLVAIPKVDKSIFRLHRDTRFSKNKSPYKTHLAIYFWEGEAKKTECSGFYFQMAPPKLLLAAGQHGFPKELLTPFREAVIDPKQGKKVTQILETIEAKNYTYGGTHYKRVPTGYDADHPNAELLKHNGLYASIETEIPDVFYSSQLVDHCFDIYSDMAPLHKWLMMLSSE